MFAADRETPVQSDILHPLPRPETTRCDLLRQIDLDRVVWDQEYREEVRLYLKSGAE
jgi:hypothetical protein